MSNTKHTATALVVDDFGPMRRIVASLLRESGWGRVIEAAHGREAMQRLGDEDIAFIVCDWNMPELDGMGLLAKVRATPRTARIPFLMMSAQTLPAYAQRAVEAGADGYLPKPFPSELLREAVEGILARRLAAPPAPVSAAPGPA